MASKKETLGDAVAQAMETLMNDEGYQQMFAKPRVVASASKPEQTQTKHAAQEALDALIRVSEALDAMGLEKSAASVLTAANDLVSELSKEADTNSDLVVEETSEDLPAA